MKRQTVKWQPVSVFCIILLGYALPVLAAISVDAVSPSLAGLGSDLVVTIDGSGFAEDTRVSLSLDSGNAGAVIGSIQTADSNSGYCVSGTTLYLANGDELQMIDVSDPEAPRHIGSLTTPLKAFRVLVAGGLAYVLGETPVLQIIDVHDPAAPRMVSVTLLPAWVTYYRVVGETVYLTLGDSWGFMVIDAVDPATPRIAGELRCQNYCLASDLEVADEVAYVTLEWGRGLQAIDVHDPTNPLLIGYIDVSDEWPTKIAVKDGLACITTQEGMLYLVDVSDPVGPKIMGSLAVGDGQRGVSLAEDDICLLAGKAGLQIIEVSDPSRPEIAGGVGPGIATQVMAVGETAFIARNGVEIVMIDIGNPQTFSQIASLDTGGATDIRVIDQLAYVINTFDIPGVAHPEEKGLRVIDVSDPSQPEIIGMLNSPGVAEDLEIVGTTAYIADGEYGVMIVDISDPANPLKVSSLDTPAYAKAITISGNLAYVADNGSGLQIVDASDPAFPQIIGWLDPPGSSMTRQVAVRDTTVYLGDRTDLLVIDVSQPSSPQLVRTIDLTYFPREFLLSGDRLYISGSDHGVDIFDVSSPEDPRLAGMTEGFASTLGLSLFDNRLYLANGSQGVSVVDVTDPAGLLEVAWVDNPPGSVYRVAVQGDFLFNASGSGGLTVLPRPMEGVVVSVGSVSSLEALLPAPPTGGTYSIRVFNDREYAELAGGLTFAEPASPLVGDWNGEGGDNLGIYFNQTFRLDYDNDGQADLVIAFGEGEDVPLVGDWDGNGMDDIGVFRPSERCFYLDGDLDGETDNSMRMGQRGDLPVVGDWDGDGTDDLGVFRPSVRRFYLDIDQDGIHDRAVSIGRPGDVPLVGDWNGDGWESIGVFRPDINRFYLDDDDDGLHDHALSFGKATDMPVTGDWDGDGVADIGVYRPASGTFFLDMDFDGIADASVSYPGN